MLVQERSVSQNDSVSCCVVCQKELFSYAFKIGGNKFLQCNNCRTIVPEAMPDSANMRTSLHQQTIHRDADALSKLVLDTIEDRSAHAPYLVISTFKENALVEKLKTHLPVGTAYANAAHLGDKQKFGTIIVLTPLSMMENLHHFFRQLKERLEQNGNLFFLQPMLDSSQAKLMKNKWLEWNQPHSFYPIRDALHIMLLNQGFDRVWFRKARYPYTLEYIRRRLKHSYSGLLSYVTALSLLLPPFLRRIKFRLPSSHVMVSCQLALPKAVPVLSVIVPVFNEKNTFEELMQALLAKSIEGLHKQIIIVESNSTDGTQELVEKYEHHPDVQVIWQKQAKGKGFAVREGLAAATGDYVLIQDADLEYDINDYDNLLAPLRENQAMFVLGSRHSGSWRIREFNDAAAVATVFNIGHVFFTWFINFLTRQRMADPFTMFKVFRRDAMFGLNFICKRFDFDHEMVIKLIRKGYQPLELPVNYRARSFAEGKKVSFIKDGLTWVYTDLKLRFGRLGRWLS